MSMEERTGSRSWAYISRQRTHETGWRVRTVLGMRARTGSSWAWHFKKAPAYFSKNEQWSIDSFTSTSTWEMASVCALCCKSRAVPIIAGISPVPRWENNTIIRSMFPVLQHWSTLVYQRTDATFKYGKNRKLLRQCLYRRFLPHSLIRTYLYPLL